MPFFFFFSFTVASSYRLPVLTTTVKVKHHADLEFKLQKEIWESDTCTKKSL